jgi:ATP-dependent protease ClpP protease subunit
MYRNNHRAQKRGRTPPHANGRDEEQEDDDEEGTDTTVRNRVFFYSDVTVKSALQLVIALDQAVQWVVTNAPDPWSVVHLHIQSSGGDAYAGISAMEHVRRCRVPVHTHVDGYVASAATFILLGGQKRLMGKYGRLLIHQLSTGFWGKYSELLEEVRNSADLTKVIQDIYMTNTLMPQKAIVDVMADEVNLTSSACLEYGIVHEVWG